MILVNAICEFLWRYLELSPSENDLGTGNREFVDAHRLYNDGEILQYVFFTTDERLSGRDSQITSTAGHGTKLKLDIFTPQPLIDIIKNNNDKDSPLVEYYRAGLYNIVKKRSGNIRYFFELLSDEIENYVQAEKREDLEKRIGNKGTNFALKSDAAYAQKLKDYFKAKLSQQQELKEDDFACALYSSLYFLAFGNICQAFTEEIHLLDKDREEFVNKVLTQYGCSGWPGVYQIYALADRDIPNAIALYEAAELEYYGKGYSNKPDFERVYEYCMKGIQDRDHYNPLCAWDLAYVIYHSYKGDRTELKNVRLRNISYNRNSVYSQVAQLLIPSYKSGCIAAANVIAEMIDDEDTPDDVRNQLYTNCKTSEEYLTYAAESGYVYAMNNLFLKAADYAKNNSEAPDVKERQKEGYRWLMQSAKDGGEPWARNRYACHLYEIGQKQEAFSYFQLAEYANNPWGTYNLIEKYYLKYLWSGVDDSADQFCERHEDELQSLINRGIKSCLQSSRKGLPERARFLTIIEQLHQRSDFLASSDTVHLYSRTDYLDVAGELGSIDAQIKSDMLDLVEHKKQTTGLAVVFGSTNHEQFYCKGTIGDADAPDVTPNTVFDIASLTKLILSVSFFMLSEKKDLDLQKTVGFYTSNLFPNLAEIRLVDLMRFDCKLETAERIDSLPYEQAIEQIRQVKVTASSQDEDYQPVYSDIPAIVLGMIFEEIAGCTFGDFVEQNIIQPLCLTHTFWRNPNTEEFQVMDYSGEMRIRNNTLRMINSTPFVVNDPKAVVLSRHGRKLTGNAGLFSSAADIAKIAQALLKGQLISTESLHKIGVSSGRPYKQRFGHLCYTKNPDKVRTEVFHGMSGNTFAMSGFTGCYLMIDPQNQCFLFIGGNRLHNRVTSVDDESLIRNGDTVLFENRSLIYSKDFVYARDRLRDHCCMKLLWDISVQ